MVFHKDYAWRMALAIALQQGRRTGVKRAVRQGQVPGEQRPTGRPFWLILPVEVEPCS